MAGQGRRRAIPGTSEFNLLVMRMAEDKAYTRYRDRQEQERQAMTPPQDALRAAWEQVAAIPDPAAFNQAVMAFDQRYGAGAFARQTELGLRRQARDRGE